MKNAILICSSIVLFGLAGCGLQPPDPAPDIRDLAEFTRQLVAQTAENTDPVDIDNIEFTFSEDETAFDDLLSQLTSAVGAG